MTLIWRMVRALCSSDGEQRQWLAVVDYLVAENRVLQQQLSVTGRRLRLTDEQRRSLAPWCSETHPGPILRTVRRGTRPVRELIRAGCEDDL